jgi:hypothetical protein
VLEQRVHVGPDDADARGGESAHGVAALDVLDLDHLGAQSARSADAAGTKVCSATSRMRTPCKTAVTGTSDGSP